ncbi:competence protein CoiA [Paraliobacillus sediminis]|uniref:competence protein CoiA n=1 Tax=Paraliobacillus sediminis TaxID=1885916 RepID=UPI000E3D505A|nr:competence protein CoiA family protein [Paraliobacillus sediminis]
MLQAITEDGQVIILAMLPLAKINVYKQKYRFYCPVCMQQVIVKNGYKMIAHFAHKKNANCANTAGGEGKYHEQGKLDLYKWFKKQGLLVALEKYLPEIKQRPDIFIRIAEKQIAIEYQCANIPIKTFLKRTQGYLKAGIIPLWILGGNRMRRITNATIDLTPSDRHFLLQFNASMATRLFFYCPQTQQLAIYKNIILTGGKRTIGNLEFVPLHALSFIQLFDSNQVKNNQFYSLWLKEKKRFRLQPQYTMQTTEGQWRQWLYLKGVSPSTISAAIHLPVLSQWKMKVPPWNWQSRLCIDFFEKRPTFTLKECQAYLQAYIEPSHAYPLIYPTSNPVAEYLHQLEHLQIIKKVSTVYYQLQRQFKVYTTVDEAMRADTEIVRQLENMSRMTHEF